MADLFCGAGGLTLGALEAGRAAGIEIIPAFAADTEAHVKDLYLKYFDFGQTIFERREILNEVLDGELGKENTESEKKLKFEVGKIDILVGGPPCQGHSNLNNHTRRNDPKNLLYDRMARFAEIFKPTYVIIENVPQAVHDRQRVVDRTEQHLQKLGYLVGRGVLHGKVIGLPQTRDRHFLVASLGGIRPDISRWENLHRVDEVRTFDWACSDLPENGKGLLDRRSIPKKHTLDRIHWLFDNQEYNLPNDQRPDCHSKKKHTYVSCYGRIHPDKPAPTLTTGFTCMGQGRFVHPHFRRTLTPREGARLQFFPNWFDFTSAGPLSRRELLSLIGNAVPPKMAYVLLLELLR
jgi:DNA (cytosine-5)-methyltransferase 1